MPWRYLPLVGDIWSAIASNMRRRDAGFLSGGPPYSKHSIRSQQTDWPVEQAHHPDISNAQCDIRAGSGEQPRQVGVGYPNLCGASSWYVGQRQIPAHGKVPCRINDLRDRAEIPARGGLPVLAEQPPQYLRLIGGHGHTLPVNWIERAHCVTKHQQAVRELPQILVAATHRSRKPEGHRVIEGLCPVERLRDVTKGQAGRERLEPTGSVGG